MALCCSVAHAKPPQEEFTGYLIEFGSSGRLGSFYPFVKNLCDTVNKQRRTFLVRCVNVETGGPLFNVNALDIGRLQMALSIETVANRFYEKQRSEENALRVVAYAYSAATAWVTRPEMAKEGMAALHGKSVWLGAKGSSGRERSLQILRESGVSDQDVRILEGAREEAESEFCDGRLDAMLFTLTDANADLEEVLECGGVLASIPDEVVQAVIRKIPGLSPLRLAPETLTGQTLPILSLGNRQLILSHSSVPANVVVRALLAIDSDKEEMRKSMQLFFVLPDMDQASARTLPIPLHEGVKAFLERGKAPANSVRPQ
jgi:TRAP transporter TAXI family solute receptor